MKLHPLIAGALITALFALEGWTLETVMELKVSVAKLTVRVDTLQPNKSYDNSLAHHP